jgi:hypothetical protein
VAATDSDRDQGAWTLPQRIGLQPRMLVSVFGTAKRGTRDKLSIITDTAAGQSLRGVLVRLTGPGVAARAKRTRADGRVTFTVRPRRKGKLLFTATKAGFQPEYAVAAVQ